MTYCISDLHGCYTEFMLLLDKIGFNPNDELYILGDAIDRGPNSVACLRYIMKTKNIHMLMGNHEHMMMQALFTESSNMAEQQERIWRKIRRKIKKTELWFGNGGYSTCKELLELPKEEQVKILEYVSDLPLYIRLTVNERKFLLVHAGIQKRRVVGTGASSLAIIKKQRPYDFLWIREKFILTKGLPSSIVIFGHTPTQMMNGDMKNTAIWHDKQHGDKIGIDGACVYGGVLNALRLDDMAEFMVDCTHQMQV